MLARFTLLLLCLTVCLGYAGKLPPSASIAISSSASVCQNSAGPTITFTGSGGTAPYTFTYTINGGTPQTIVSTGTGNSATLSGSTSVAGIRTYTLVSVEDSSGTVNIGNSVSFTVLPQPDAALGGTGGGSIFDGLPVFRVCGNTTSLFIFTNTSNTQSSNQSYTINWGDGTPNFSGTTWTSLSHSYNVGIYTLTYTIVGTNGCSVTKLYTVFVGLNPAVALGNPGNTDICSNQTLTFPITGTANNPVGTIYTVTFNDGSAPQVFNHPPPSGVTHTFNVSSCGTTSSDGSNSYPNSFSANIVASNPCSTSSVGVVPIYVSKNPEANFDSPLTACVATQVCFQSTSSGNAVLNGTCENPKLVWTISPAMGFTLAGGSLLGNDFGFTDTGLWQSGSQNLCLSFTSPGTYTITLKIGNKCGVDTQVKTICVAAPLAPQFTLNNTSGCAPMSVTATNTTNMTALCGTASQTWSVTHTPGFCGTTPVTIPNQTTQNASFNFTQPGTYTITLTTTNSCGTTQASQTVTVKKAPTASINPIGNLCGPGSIIPQATVNSCAPPSSTLTYAWSFPGGTPASSMAANPGPVSYTTAGNHTVSLVVTNECGSSTVATQTFTLNPQPVVGTVSNQTICSGTSTTAVTLTSTPPNATFTWTAAGSAGVSGFQASGTGNIPPTVLTYTGSGTGTVTYTITPTLNGCQGPNLTYQVQVAPAPVISAQPQSQTLCQNATPSALTMAVTGSGTPTFQWYVNTTASTAGGTLIAGATSSNYTPPATNVGTLYYYAVASLPTGGCASLTSQVATLTVVPPPSITTQPTLNHTVCVGATIDPLSVVVSGGTGTPSYQWYSNSINSNTGGTPVGTNSSSFTPPVFTAPGEYFYYVTITLAGSGCGTIASAVSKVTVLPDPALETQPIASQTLCQGSTPQALSVSATGGQGTFSYQWYSHTTPSTTGGTAIPGANQASYTPTVTAVGNYYYYCVVSQPTSGCEVTSQMAQITVNTSPSVSVQPVPSQICQGGLAQQLSFSTQNGAGTATYQWYSNTIESNTGGTAIAGATNPAYNPPTGVVGTLWYYATVTFSGITGDCATIATQPTLVEVSPNAEITVQPDPKQSVCVGHTLTNPLSITYTLGTGLPTYQWYSNTTNSTTGGTPVGSNQSTYTPPVFTSPGTYYYYVTVQLSGNGCNPVTSQPAQVVVIADPEIAVQPLISQTLCPGETAQALSVTANGGIGSDYNYQWYVSTTPGNTGGVAIGGATGSDFVPPTDQTGTLYYYCEVTQPNGLGCDVTSQWGSVTVSPAPSITTQPVGQTLCGGQTASPLSIDVVNGVGPPVYQWYANTTASNADGTAITGANQASFTPQNNTVGTFHYYVTVSYPDLTGNCSSVTSDVATVIIEQNPEISNQSEVICSNTAFSVTPSTNGTDIVPASTTYSWGIPVITPPGSVSGALAESNPQTTISQTLINTTTQPATVTYMVTPVAGDCTGQPFTITVTVNPAIAPNVTVNDNQCFGADSAGITTNVTGGIPFPGVDPYQFTWTGPDGFASSASSIVNLAPGNYTVTITDAGGCPFTETYTITEPPQLVFESTLQQNITCHNAADGSITLNIAGGTPGYIYTWTKDTMPFSDQQNLTNLAPGVYVVSVTDANNCTPITMQFTITQPEPLVATLVAQTNVECYGESTGDIVVSVTGGTPIELTPGNFGYAFSWTGPDGFTSNVQNPSDLFAGNYVLTVTDDNNCQFSLPVTITQSPEIIISYTTTEITCYGANDANMTVTLSGGIAPYTFTWSNLSTDLNQTNLSAGTYTIIVTDALGCQKTESIVIPEAPLFAIDPVVTQISCHGEQDGSIQLNFVGGIAPVTLVWSDGSTAGTTRNGLAAGTYTVTITDSKPCVITQTFIIVEPSPLVLSASLEHALACDLSNNGAIDLLVSGGTPPYAYSWSNGGNQEDLTQLTNGNYSVTVTDSRGCVIQGQYTILRPDPMAIQIVENVDFDCETRYVDITYEAQVSGGVPPFVINWSSGAVSGANNQFMNTSSEGLVTVTATDSRGCEMTLTYNVDIPQLGSIGFEPVSIGSTYYGIFSIEDPITFESMLTGDYQTLIWDFGDGTFSNDVNPVHTYVNPGSYVVKLTVTYPLGCEYSQTITLNVEEGYFLTIPTAFTPNDDSLNDTYRPVSKRLESLTLEIYDSWGSMIYSEKGDVLTGWDGTVKGLGAENGNYYCTVTGKTFYGRTITERRTFVLIK